MSLGEKQKINLLISFLKKDSIILLDEPFNALDTVSKINLCLIFHELREEDYTIIYISHGDEQIDYDYLLSVENKKIVSRNSGGG